MGFAPPTHKPAPPEAAALAPPLRPLYLVSAPIQPRSSSVPQDSAGILIYANYSGYINIVFQNLYLCFRLRTLSYQTIKLRL